MPRGLERGRAECSLTVGRDEQPSHGRENTGRTAERQFCVHKVPSERRKPVQSCEEITSLSWNILQFLTPFHGDFLQIIPTVQSSSWELLLLTLERQNLSPGCALRWQEVDGCQFRLWWRIPGNDVWNNHLGMRRQGEEVMERMGTFPLQSDSSFQICV